ncbi:major paralogous domain-containing protein [Fibrobacter sp. UWOV1]|uniref:FISUMP domain-containing protein n=1 Tax=Fibrobacter sp. UWOV1 TaxID=1896215 RepID=UPI00091CF83F|nr:FISUMP domain-containing protein [Fibrobacter sp. UWOV1]SHL02410.1 major paralogous domain-containing protein [Fibrobacter sp. UWOV1]
MWLRTYLFAILVASATVFAAEWTGSAVEPENMKKIDGKSFYVITTAEELAWFAAQVNSGQTTINAVLDNDIVFGSSMTSIGTYNWTPIGKDSSHIFNGIFDGDNHKIYGLNITGDTVTVRFSKTHTVLYERMDLSSLVGILGTSGIVKNLEVVSGRVVGRYVGGCVAQNRGHIQNCVNRNKIVSYHAIINGMYGNGDLYMGGIAGYNSGTISDCKNNGSVTHENSGSDNVANMGGIVGYNSGRVYSSDNNGSLGSTRTNYVGGVVGKNLGVVEECSNSGSFSSTTAGGIAGSNSGEIRKCLNSATIGGNGNGGGIVGENSGLIDYVYNKGLVTCGDGTNSGGLVALNSGTNAVLKNSFNLAIVECKNSGAKSGGALVMLNKNSGKIINTYYDATVLTGLSAVKDNSATITNVSGKYTTDMQTDQFAWILNTSNGTEENSGVWTRGTDGYPTWATEDSLAIHKVVFDDDGTTSNRYTNYKGQVSFPENPEAPVGLVFSGWYNSNDIKVKPTTVFSVDQTVNAVYVDASDVFWTINFYNAVPADTVLESKSYQHGSIVTYGGVAPTLASTAQYIYTFKGWDVEPTNAVEDFDYHAVYDSTIRSYAISFNNTDGSEIEKATFEYGKMPSCSKTPTRDATVEWTYSHKGWKPALDYVTEAAAYTAIYDSSKIKYKVTFMNGTTVIDEQMIPYGDSAVAPANVTREGYKFVGWNTSFAEVTEALTVKALFEELIIRIVNVVNGDGEKIDSVKVENGETYMLPEAPKKDGYTFDAYYDGNLKLGVAGDKITVTANITIIAKYIENPKSSSSSAVSSSSNPKSSSSKVGSSSSEVKSSSSTQSTVVYGELYDERDDRKYRTVVIGSQIWMAENLSYVTSESWCYKDDTSNCIKYGRLYRQGAAAQACPAGWHLPSKSEFQKLFDYVGGVSSAGLYLKTTSGWNNNSNGKDQYGFSVLPAGIRREDGYYYDIGGHAIFWMSDKYAHVDVVEAADVRIGSDNVTYGFSVRCLMTSDSSSIFVSSSSTAKSSSSVAKSSSSRVRSSSSAKSSSSSKVRSSSSAKTNAIEVSVVPQFFVQVVGRNLQISTARIGNAYALFDLQGKVLLQGRVQSANFEIPVARSGNYLIRVGNNVQRIAVK